MSQRVIGAAAGPGILEDLPHVTPKYQPAMLNKKHVVESSAPKRISAITFSMFSPHDIIRLSSLQVVNRSLYQIKTHEPTPNGVLDPRLGTSQKDGVCLTCGSKMADCVGHFGYIELELPVFHIGYFKAVLQILKIICKSCSRVMMAEEEREKFLQKLRSPLIDTQTRERILKGVYEKAKRPQKCPMCGARNGNVKKSGSNTQTLKIIHEIHKATKGKEEDKRAELRSGILADPIKENEELEEFLLKLHENLNPSRTIELFSAIPPDDVELLGMNPLEGRPEHLILTHLLVPPLCIRPSVLVSEATGSNEDDLTMKLTEIIHINLLIKEHKAKGAAVSTVQEAWDFLQLHAAMYINSELPGMSSGLYTASKPLRSLCQRLKGKQGRFRGNLSGKRVDFSSRTVISPDPNLSVDEVAIPKRIAMILTIPERVFASNIEKLRQLVIAGPDSYPGANFAVSDHTKKYLRYANREDIAKKLKAGDLVERHLLEGDIVLFNRQPSLHRMSIMAHRIKITEWRTFQFNECVCTPYNADFDGDEMNVHVPQTEEARAEAATLLSVTRNLATPRNGGLIVAPIQDIITASYLLTKKDRFFDRGQFSQICTYMGLDSDTRLDLPPPCIWKPRQFWSGKQLFSAILRPKRFGTIDNDIVITYEAPNGSYSGGDIRHQCLNEGYVCFRNSEFICGQLDKKTLGSGSKSSVCYIVMRDVSAEAAVTVMNRITRMCIRWMSNYGFSIGVDDVWPSQALVQHKENLVQSGYAKCNEYIEKFENGTLKEQPGCNAEETLEAMVTGELSQIREDAGRVCLNELHTLNSPLLMAKSGAKGSTLNISQMVACVGQQTVSGNRIPNGFVDRSLPHYAHNAKEPESRGFVKNSFFSGMTPSEFFFHTMGGREGLVDTAVKTAETGYMQRRLMKALEDLSCRYDNTVRTSVGGVIQFIYGEDGLDPFVMEGTDRPVDFKRTAVGLIAKGTSDGQWDQSGMEQIIRAEAGECSQKFVDELIRFCLDSSTARVFSRDQFDQFLKICVEKFRNALVQPGEGVGAVAAQSLGEPATQMTLKTFHFAGVASMNVTLGVPRIKEIINASRTISTPIITATLVSDSSVEAARIVKGRIEKTTLGEVCRQFTEVITSDQCHIRIELDLDTINRLQLEVNPTTVVKSIIGTSKLKIKPNTVRGYGDNVILVAFTSESKDKEKISVFLQRMRIGLPMVIVAGISSVSRAVISEKEGSEGKYELIVEGNGLLNVMGVPGIDGLNTRSNHILEVESALGIEGARKSIMDEIRYTMQSHGIHLDVRHVMLLADLMTYRGEVLGITRFGIGKMKESVLMLASFEKTTDHLFDAAVHARRDSVVGVSECIILGMPIPLGTGMMGLTVQTNESRKPAASTRRSALLDELEYQESFICE